MHKHILKDFKRKEPPTILYHYSVQPDLKEIDPNFQGTGSAGEEEKRTDRVPRSYYYNTMSDHEPSVVEKAKSLYTIVQPKKVLELTSDEAKPFKTKSQQTGLEDLSLLEKLIKEAGYDGYTNLDSGVPNAVVLFYSQPVSSEQSLDLNKGEITDKLKALGVGASLVAALNSTPIHKEPTIEYKPVTKESVLKKKILGAMSHVESEDRYDAKHPVLASGMHKGDKAIGKYAIMPKTAMEMIKKNPELKQKYGHLLKLNSKAFHTLATNNKQMQEDLANKTYDRLAGIFGHDVSKISHAWLNGVTGTKKAIANGEDLKSHWHVKKVLKAYKDQSEPEQYNSIINKTEDFDDFEALEKAADDDLVAKLPESHQNMKSDLLNWSREKIPHPAARAWYLGHIIKNPSLHEQHKTEMEHHGNMFKINKELNKMPFNKKLGLDEGFQQMRNMDTEYQKKSQEQTKGLVKPSPETKKEIDLGSGWGWHNLNKNKCGDESAAMGHCGTGHRESNLWSLRREVKGPKGETLHEPHITVEMLPGGVINQIKGKNNKKPHPKYHDAILPLLQSNRVNHIISQGYMPETNFHVGDLEDGKKAELIKQKPDIHPFDMTDVGQLDKTLEKIHPEFRPKLKQWRDTVEAYGNLDNAIDKGDTFTLRTLGKHPSMTTERLDRLTDSVDRVGSKDGDFDVDSEIAENPNTSGKSLMKIVNRNPDKTTIHSAVASHPNIKGKDLDFFINHEDDAVRGDSMENPNLSREQLDKGLNNENSWFTRKMALRNPQVNREDIVKGLKDSNAEVRREAMTHSSITEEDVRQAANDPHWQVRHAAATHHKTPQDVLEKLTNPKTEGDNEVRAEAARNKNISSEQLLRALDDPDRMVQRYAMHNKDKLDKEHLDKALKKDLSFKQVALSHPKITKEQAKSVIYDPEPLVRRLAEEVLKRP